jgi:hypothetical protein
MKAAGESLLRAMFCWAFQGAFPGRNDYDVNPAGGNYLLITAMLLMAPDGSNYSTASDGWTLP